MHLETIVWSLGKYSTKLVSTAGIDVLYPKEGASFSKQEQQTVYLILGNKEDERCCVTDQWIYADEGLHAGNKAHNAKLKEITIPRGSSEGSAARMDTHNIEDLSKVALFQLDMNQLDGALPDNFAFRYVTTKALYGMV